MECNLFPWIVPFLGTVILIHLPTSLCVVNERYEICGKVTKCGNITITYPFFTGEQARPSYCGSYESIFQLHCRNNQILTIIMEEITYRVVAIDYSTHTLTVARNDYWYTYCPTTYLNTTLDTQFFKFLDPFYADIIMYYGCPSNITGYANRQFTCLVNRTNIFGYYSMSSIGLSNPNSSRDGESVAMGACTVSVDIPTSASAVETLDANSTLENLIAALHGGVELSWYENNGLCSACVVSGGQCGSNDTFFGSDSESEFSCYCPDKPYPFICGSYSRPNTSSSPNITNPNTTGSSPSPNIKGSSSNLNITGSSSNLGIKLEAGISATVACSIIVVLVLCFLRREDILYKSMIFRRKKTKNDQDVDAFIRNNGYLLALKQYRYSDVKKITKTFTDKVGQGGYGCVYKGKLSDGRLVAVKILSESKGTGEEFLNEVASISRTSHVNVVALLGLCYERTKRALIYEFMPNGSLDQFIYIGKSSNTKSQLEWKTLYQIAVGIARGLEYLHIGCNMRILHFDIKPHNILLDEEFCPKISNFGLAKLCQRKESTISMLGARGTAGYIAPEVFSRHFGGVSYKSDVYSYGMMVLEIVGGRRNIEVGVSNTSEIYFPHWIFKYLEPASTELRLNRVITEDEEDEFARKMILVGLWCIQTKPSDRPSMTKVVEMLEGSIQSIQIPPKPFLSSPQRSPPQHSSTVSVSESLSNIG